MKKHYKRNGSSYLMIILVFVFVSSFSALMLSTLNQSIYQTNAYGLQMQCYYLNNQAAKATVAVLLKDKDDDYEFMKTASFPQTAVLTHTNADGSQEVGRSTIQLTKEYHDYYSESRAWIVARITTTIKDKRSSNSGNDFTYEGTAMVLVENPIIQLYNINPENVF